MVGYKLLKQKPLLIAEAFLTVLIKALFACLRSGLMANGPYNLNFHFKSSGLNKTRQYHFCGIFNGFHRFFPQNPAEITFRKTYLRQPPCWLHVISRRCDTHVF